LTKECKKQKGLLNYEWWKLKLSFATVENWTKWESDALKKEVIDILTDWGFVVSKKEASKTTQREGNSDLMSLSIKKREISWSSEQYLKEILLHLDKTDIQWRVDIFKALWFSFENEGAFIKQVETARWEW
jgi:aspartyl/asparaginyl beta-hydroxylase (cupin superfamily)